MLNLAPDQVADAFVLAVVADRGSFTEASRELGLSKSAVSARVRRLEAHFDTPLLRRTTRTVQPTEDGAQLVSHVRLMQEHWRDALDLLDSARQQPVGTLRVTAPSAFAEAVVSPVVTEMLDEFPQLTVDLLSDDRNLDLVRDNIDAAVRMAKPRDSSTVVRRIGEELGWVTVAASSQWASLRHLSADRQLRALPELPWVGSREDGNGVTLTPRAGGTPQMFEPRYRAWVPGGLGLAALVRSGAGAAVLPESMLAGRTDLVRLATTHHGGAWPIWLLRPSRRHVPARVRQFVERLEQRLTQPIYSEAPAP